MVPNINRAGRIEFANLPVGVTTTLASTDNIPYTPCIAVDSIVRANRREFSIKFNENLMWHTDTLMPTPLPANTFDLESRALHELGHAHLLNHSNNPNDLMYFTDVTPPYRRIIMPNDEAGGDYIMGLHRNKWYRIEEVILHAGKAPNAGIAGATARLGNAASVQKNDSKWSVYFWASPMSISTPTAPTGCQTEMTALTPANCGLTNVIEIEQGIQASIDIFPNPTTGKLFISIHSDSHSGQINDFQATIFDLLGRKIIDTELTQTTSTLSLSEVSNGLYVLTISYQGHLIDSFKVQKQ